MPKMSLRFVAAAEAVYHYVAWFLRCFLWFRMLRRHEASPRTGALAVAFPMAPKECSRGGRLLRLVCDVRLSFVCLLARVLC